MYPTKYIYMSPFCFSLKVVLDVTSNDDEIYTATINIDQRQLNNLCLVFMQLCIGRSMSWKAPLKVIVSMLRCLDDEFLDIFVKEFNALVDDENNVVRTFYL